MSRTLSDALKAAVFAHDCGDAYLTLVTITCGATVIRLVNDTADLVSRGHTYTACPLGVQLPSDKDEIPTASLVVANVARQITQVLDALTQPMQVRLEQVFADTPDDVEVGPIDLYGFSPIGDAFAVRVQLQYERVATSQYPGDRFTPASTPALF